MKSFVLNILMRFYRKLLRHSMYAIHDGDKSGAFFVYIKECDVGKTNAILLMPNPMESKYINVEEIRFDIKNRNIRFVKRLPKPVYDVCKANFIYYAKKEGIYASR